MRKKEQRLWDCFKEHCGHSLALKRVENLADDGMPDVYSVETGAWVEMKAPTTPKRATTPLLGNTEGLRQSQKNWIKDAVNRGRRVFVLVRDSENELYLLDGALADSLNAMTKNELRSESLANTWRGIELFIAYGDADRRRQS